MGNITQSPIKNNSIETSKIEEKPDISLINEDIFIKILNVSNDLLKEYNNDFLKEDFCNKLALIYEKKLSKFNIKILKSLYNNINSTEIDNNLLLTVQYHPKDDDKFLVDIFKDSLNENFWKKNVELIPGTISNNSEIESYIKYTPNYISLKHVNYLLDTINNKKEENINELNNIKVGGKYNINSFQKKNNIRYISNNISLEEKNSRNRKKSSNNNILENSNNNLENNNLEENFSNNINDFEEESSNRNHLEGEASNRNRLDGKASNRNRLDGKASNRNRLEEKASNGNYLKETRSNKNRVEEKASNRNRVEGKSVNENLLEGKSVNENLLEGKSVNGNRKEEKASNQNRVEGTNSNRNRVEGTNSNRNRVEGTNSNRNRVEGTTTNKNRVEGTTSNKNRVEGTTTNKNRVEGTTSNKNHVEGITSNKNRVEDISLEDINKITNNSIIKNSIKVNKNETEILNKTIVNDKFINKIIKYSVPNYYKEPVNFCNNKDKCELTKKQLCQSISENFIVRNNIIAAILTTIPYKNENNEYEGGICYQKFMNLEKCHVCVPYDYNELKDKDIKDVLTKILEKASYLNKNQCRENNGYFLALSGDEKKILSKKIIKSNKDEIEKHPKIKYNLFFKEFTDKLKKNYFDNLTLLLNILEKMKNTIIINNTTLNILSEETKKIIDNMYNLCHYYYIYAIISLINADITEEIIKEDKLESIISIALDK